MTDLLRYWLMFINFWAGKYQRKTTLKFSDGLPFKLADSFLLNTWKNIDVSGYIMFGTHLDNGDNGFSVQLNLFEIGHGKDTCNSRDSITN